MKAWPYKELDVKKIGNMNQIAGIRHYEFCDGKAKGVEAAEIHTGSGLVFTVLPGRGMDIAWTEYKGTPINYMSKTGVVSPAYYESAGMEWLHSFFAGTLTTCGLLNAGGPEKVMHPVIGERIYGLHGRISNSAAEQVSVFEDWVDGEYVMKVSGRMQEATLHGEQLSLRREITAKYGANEFKLHDVITNHAEVPQDVMVLYHINFGYPLLDADTRIIAPTGTVTPTSDAAAAEVKDVYTMTEPLQDRPEWGYAYDFDADKDGMVRIAIVNDRLDFGVYRDDRLDSCQDYPP